jgi:hypothetical protein
METAMNRAMRVLATTAIAVALGTVFGWDDPGNLDTSGISGAISTADHYDESAPLLRGTPDSGPDYRGHLVTRDRSRAIATADDLDASAPPLRATQAAAALARDFTTLRAAVAAFADVDQAASAGYGPSSECMTSEDGAQGIHYANEALFEPAVAVEAPQLLMYEPLADGSLRFLGVEYLVFQKAWHDAGHVERPVLFGRTFDLNETLLDEPFYLLHVWLSQFNPNGVFANWNPLVDCGHAAGAH